MEFLSTLARTTYTVLIMLGGEKSTLEPLLEYRENRLFSTDFSVLALWYNVNGQVHPITCHEGTEWGVEV
jgi:hypothetical protein